jgi:hypothetical protein
MIETADRPFWSVSSLKGPIMRVRVWIAGCVALCSINASVHGAEKFERKYVESSQQVKETESKVDQTLTVAGMAVETKALTFQTTKTEIGKRDAEGKLPVVETVTSLRSDLELQGGVKISFDSANPDQKADNPLFEPLMEVFRTLVKNPVTALVDRENHIAEVKIANNAQEQLPKEVQSFLQPERQKRDREQAWSFLPDKEVEVGDEWERFVDQDLGGGQNFNFKMKYTYAGPEQKDTKTYHKFGLEHLEVTYALDPNANPMVQVPKSDLKIVKSSGSILYDPATGEVPFRESTVKINGTLTLTINGMDLPSELDLTMTEKSTLQQ